MTSLRRPGGPLHASRWLAAVGLACAGLPLLPALLASSAEASLGAAPPLELAYLDPGTGSFLVQALVASVAGVAVTVRLYWKRIRRFFGLAPSEGPASSGPDGDEDSSGSAEGR